MEVIILGCGSSFGVPVPACPCGVCNSNNQKNKRLRSSVFINHGNTHILIDAGPDTRQKLIDNGIGEISAVLVTHPHYDHVGGLIDLRGVSNKMSKKINCFMSFDTCETLKGDQAVFFKCIDQGILNINVSVFTNDFGFITCDDVKIDFINYLHSENLHVTGFKIDNFAYITDIKEWSSEITDFISDVEKLVLGVNSWNKRETSNHISVEEAIEVFKNSNLKELYLTHMPHELDFVNHEIELPPGMFMSYDGLVINV